MNKELLERKKQLDEKINFYRAKKRYDDYLLSCADDTTDKNDLDLLKKKAKTSTEELGKAYDELTDLLKELNL
jgi:hypothetical protein